MATTVKRPEFLAFALTALVIVAHVVLAATGHPDPDWFGVIAVGGLTGGAGLSIPNHTHGDTSTTDTVNRQVIV